MQAKTNSTTFSSPRFTLGQIVATPAVLEHLERHGVKASEYLNRPVRGDWGDVPSEDAKEIEFAVTRRLRLLSSYAIARERVWIITEADRSSTCLLFPSEY